MDFGTATGAELKRESITGSTLIVKQQCGYNIEPMWEQCFFYCIRFRIEYILYLKIVPDIGLKGSRSFGQLVDCVYNGLNISSVM